MKNSNIKSHHVEKIISNKKKIKLTTLIEHRAQSFKLVNFRIFKKCKKTKI